MKAKKTVDRLHTSLSRLVQSFNPPSGSDKTIVQLVERAFGEHLRHYEKPHSESHFKDIFDGLQALAPRPSAPDHRQVLLECRDPAQKIRLVQKMSSTDATTAFNTLFYHGKLTPGLARVFLRNRTLNLAQLDSFVTLVLSGGTLIPWRLSDKYAFRIQAANAYWRLGFKDKAQSFLVDEFASVWKPQLSGALDPVVYQALTRAMLALNQEQLLLEHLSPHPAASVPVWQALTQSGRFDSASVALSGTKLWAQTQAPGLSPLMLATESLCMLHSRMTPELAQVLSELKVWLVPSTDLADTGALIRLLGLFEQLGGRGFGSVVGPLAVALNGHLDTLLAQHQGGSQSISLALAVQRLHVLQQRAVEEGTGPESVGSLVQNVTP